MPAAKQPNGVVPFAVPRFNVLNVLTQDELDVKLTAPAQSSLAGGECVIQILNVLVLLFCVYTRI